MARRGNLRGRSYSVRFGKGLRSPTVYPAPIRSRLGRLRGSAAGVIRKRVAANASSYNPLYRQGARKLVKTPVGGVTSMSKCFIGSKRTKKLTTAKLMQRLGAPNFDVSQLPFRLDVPEGFQSAIACNWNRYEDLRRMIERTPNNTTVPPGNYQATNRFELTNCVGELLMTNSSLATAYVEIYDLVCKRDSPPPVVGSVGFMNMGDPIQAWATGINNASASPASNKWQTLKSLPFESQAFNLYFKVVRRHHVSMPQGSTHRHSFTTHSNKIIDNELIDAVVGTESGTSVTLTTGNYQGLTMYTMVVAYGQPCSIPADPPAGPIVTTSRIALDLVQTKRYKYTFVQDTTRSAFYQDNLSSLGGEQVVSIGAGQIVANAVV